MYQYSPDSNDFVDERFDTLYNEKSNNSSQQHLEYLFNNLTVSPPYEKEDNKSSSDLICFKEEIYDNEEVDYPTAATLFTPVNSPPLSEIIDNDDDESLVIDESLIIEETTQPIAVYVEESKPPASMYDYHKDLMDYYKNAILRQTDPQHVMQSIESTLPDSYKHYLACIKQLPSSTCL